MEPEHFSFTEFRKNHLTPWFRQVRYRTYVATTTKYITCCHLHLLDQWESTHDYEPPLLPAMAYTREDAEDYTKTGDMYIVLYGITPYQKDWILSLAETNRLSMEFECNVCDGCELWRAAKKYEIRPRMKRYFFAAIWLRIGFGRLLQRIYRPPDGRMFLKLRDDWFSSSAS